MNDQAYENLKGFFGTYSALATKLGSSRSSVAQWRTRGVPILKAVAIESMTKGEIPATELLSPEAKLLWEKAISIDGKEMRENIHDEV